MLYRNSSRLSLGLQRETPSDPELSLALSSRALSGLAWLLPLLDENGPLCISVAVSQEDLF